VELHTSVAGRVQPGMQLSALGKDGSRREVQVEELWPHRDRLVLKFAGVNSISEAETLLGCELQVPLEQRARLERGWNYVSDLVGCTVFDGYREIGRVRDLQFGAGEAPLLVIDAQGRELEIPYAEAYLADVDLERRQIRMHLPEGMLEVNAPLTEEEKRQQRDGKRKLSS
jgi:16S rRNA processing protein RimM